MSSDLKSDVNLKSLKGMQDILPAKSIFWQFLEDKIRNLMAMYGYDEIRFPILEKTDLFARSLGHSTDVVEKEMFTFQDRDKHKTFISLRPEGTAGCARACLENGLIRNNQQQKLWYLGPMFRRENPQKGRFRQFHQFGVESFGFKDPMIEAEHILIMDRLWKNLGISEHVTLELNTIGTLEERTKYKLKLQEYFSRYENDLDEDCKRRLTTNPLRILDSKNLALEKIIKSAPLIFDFLGKDSIENFEDLKDRLNLLDITFNINPKIVRGLDYYNNTVYEWITDKLGAKSEVCAGGRFDGLVNVISDDHAYGVGFGMGIERVLMLLEECKKTDFIRKNLDGYLIVSGKDAEQKALFIAEKIHSLFPKFKLMVNCGGGTFKSQFKKADKSGAKFALILGDDEITNNCIGIKFLREERSQMNVPMEDLIETLGGLCGTI